MAGVSALTQSKTKLINLNTEF